MSWEIRHLSSLSTILGPIPPLQWLPQALPQFPYLSDVVLPPPPAPTSTRLSEACEHVQSNPVGVSGLGPRRHLETAGEEGPRPGVNTCNRQELQLAGAGAGAGEELSWLEAVDPTDRQTDRQMGRSHGQA